MEPTKQLRCGRRFALQVDGFELLEDFVWHSNDRRWSLKFRMIGTYRPSNYVPIETYWFVLIAPEYPYGKIDIYPAVEDGIQDTFPHQTFNSWNGKSMWRDGKICVDTSLGKWGKRFFNKEPYDESLRLAWHISRCREWINCAASDSLTVNGDPFELPSFPKDNTRVFVFNENSQTFYDWLSVDVKAGFLQSKSSFDNAHIYPIISFTNKTKTITYEWGKLISESKGSEATDIWVLLEEMPIIPPYKVPETWGELFEIALLQKIELPTILYNLIFKSKISPHFILIGFPLPLTLGEEFSSIYWFACHIPSIPHVLNGFRPNTDAIYREQYKRMFSKNSQIKWTNTESWNKQDISVRGRIDQTIEKSKFLITGAGAVGSCFAELLVRLGCANLTIFDGDLLAIGNLSRHTLSMDQIRTSKAKALEKHLNSIVPYACVVGIEKPLDNKFSRSDLETLLHNHDFFVDATGDDAVIDFMTKFLTPSKKIFISISLGYAANRLFCYLAKLENNDFLKEDFHKKLSPWLEKEKKENPNPEFAMDGIGCWHPVFPARIDDISMLISAVIKQIELFNTNSNTQRLIVVEKKFDLQGAFNGIEIIEN